MRPNAILRPAIFAVLTALSCKRAQAESMYIVARSLIDPLNATVITNPVVITGLIQRFTATQLFSRTH